MQYRGLDGKHRSSARGGAARSIKSSAAGAALTLTTLLTLVTVSGMGCGDDDTITPPGGGAGGSAGRGGTGGGGSGGGGTGGGGAGGTAGTAGTAGTGGTGGSGGSGGTGGDGGVSREDILTAYCAKLVAVTTSANDGDAGVAADAGDAGPALACTAPEDCVAAEEGFYTGFLEVTPGYEACVDEADAYYLCKSTAPASEFECADGAPQYILGSPTCEDEEEAFNAGLADPTNCAD